MKRYFLIAVLTLGTGATYAQKNATYCQLNVYQPAFKNYVAKVSYGDEGNKARFVLLKNETGSKMKFSNEIQALNYIAKQGWELVSTYHNHGGETRFFLKK